MLKLLNPNMNIKMKKFTMIFLAVLTIAAVTTAFKTAENLNHVEVSNEGKPELVFEKKSHDFGVIEEGAVATTTFVFKNTGNAPLILQAVTASCGCTTPKWSREPINPGETGEITAAYNSQGRPGNFTKSITVKHNGENGVEYLTIRGNVVRKDLEPVSPVVVPSN